MHLLCLMAIAFATRPVQIAQPYLHAPSVTTYAKHNPSGLGILSNGRYIHPVGRNIPVAAWPHGLEISPDGSTAFVASSGVGQLITNWTSGKPEIHQIVPVGSRRKGKNGGGAAFSPDGSLLYWSGGDSGNVYVYDTATQQLKGEIELNVSVGGRKYADSYASDVKISKDGATLYFADVTNFRVVTADAATLKVIGSVGVGRYPYALAVAGSKVYVANIGMFEYSPLPDLSAEQIAKAKEQRKTSAGVVPDPRGLSFPPFGFPSKEARDGVTFEGRKIPGLGDPNVAESFSVWGVDVADPASPKVIRKIKTGLLVGAPSDKGKTVGGSAPNFLAVGGDQLYVSNGNNDIVERIDLASGKIVVRKRIVPSPLTAKLRGVGPSGLAVSPDGRTLCVAEFGINAMAILDAKTLVVKGHVPTAWYPYRVAFHPAGDKIMVINFRGFGNGPEGIKDNPTDEFLHMRGAVTVLDTPSQSSLAETTKNVLIYNGMTNKTADLPAMASPVVPTQPGKKSDQIKYVVFITKENHTYDAIFDHIKGANGDPNQLRWGLHQTISAPGQPTLQDAPVMTNHNALARQFTVSDNFYMEPEASGVGHRWLVGVQPNVLMQMTYTLGWGFKAKSSAPGRRYSMGSNGSLLPEDYPEAGSMWEHLASHGISFRNYGEGFEFPGVGEDEDEHPTGAREVGNYPMPKVLFDNTCREFPIFNMDIPDQYRAYWFEKDFKKITAHGKKDMPQFVNIAICNDHGSGPKPNRGYPYVASWMADNDLALGRIVEFLSHTKYWKNMAIFVTQDDSGGDGDHVDKQRSVLLAISPWIRRSYVSHRHTTIVSMHRTLYELFGLPALNMFDGLANDFSDCFTTKPDFRPYTCVPIDKRVFDPEKAKNPKDPDYKDARRESKMRRDNDEDEEQLEKLIKAGGTKPSKAGRK